MKKYIGIVFCLILVNYAASALAAEQVQYQQKKLYLMEVSRMGL